MYLGKIENRACHIGNAAPNSSIILTGLSGSGKSCRQNQIELEAVKQGNTVIVIDGSQNHSEPYIFSDIRAEYCRHTNRIKVATDGLGFRLFAPVRNTANEEEPFPALVNANVQTLRAVLSLGSKQTAILREAIIEAIKFQAHQPVLNDAQVLNKAFENHQDNPDWCPVYQKLWTLLHYNVLQSKRQHLQKQAINIFDLAGMDTLSSDSLAEVILAYI